MIETYGGHASPGLQQPVVLISGVFSSSYLISSPAVVSGNFNAQIWGLPLTAGLGATFSATVVLDRSLDNGITWIPVGTDGTGTPNAYTVNTAVAGYEPEFGALYRFRCSSYSSGSPAFRLSQILAPIAALTRSV